MEDAVGVFEVGQDGEEAGAVEGRHAQVLGLERDFFFPAGNTSITIVRVRSSDMHRVLFILNDIAHLAFMRKK